MRWLGLCAVTAGVEAWGPQFAAAGSGLGRPGLLQLHPAPVLAFGQNGEA